MEITSAWKTAVGKVRGSNEDNVFCDGLWLEDGRVSSLSGRMTERRFHTYAVCDGMGGESYGEVAALIAVQILKTYDQPNLGARFQEYIDAANGMICRERIRRSVSRMGAAIVLLTVSDGSASICNLGDCRAYRFDSTGLEQLSVDHRSDGPGMFKGVLTQHLGISEEEFLVEPYIRTGIGIRGETIFLLCSDGLTDMVSDRMIETILEENRQEEPERIADSLVKEAYDGGGRDNVSVMVVKAK